MRAYNPFLNLMLQQCIAFVLAVLGLTHKYTNNAQPYLALALRQTVDWCFLVVTEPDAVVSGCSRRRRGVNCRLLTFLGYHFR